MRACQAQGQSSTAGCHSRTRMQGTEQLLTGLSASSCGSAQQGGDAEWRERERERERERAEQSVLPPEWRRRRGVERRRREFRAQQATRDATTTAGTRAQIVLRCGGPRHRGRSPASMCMVRHPITAQGAASCAPGQGAQRLPRSTAGCSSSQQQQQQRRCFRPARVAESTGAR